MQTHERRSLLCRVQGRLCALPLGCVIETMRPLPVEPMAGAPPFVLGVSIIRGAPLPVVDLARLLGAPVSTPSRYVSVRVESRRVALAVDAVLGVVAIADDALSELPPLLRDATSDVVSAIGALDAQLLVVLNEACMVPDSVWQTLGGEASG